MTTTRTTQQATNYGNYSSARGTTTAVYSVTVTCDCAACETNAKHLGRAFPLAARTTAENAAVLKITDKNANNSRKTHGIVYLANHPMLGPAQRSCIPGA